MRENALWSNYVRHRAYHSKENSEEQRNLLRRAYRPIQRHKIKEKLSAGAGFRKKKEYSNTLKCMLMLLGFLVAICGAIPTPRG
jgi:hypothetical protein